MTTFLQQSIEDIQSLYSDISEITFILPSRRAGGFLKNELRTRATRTQFAPKIISIEEFIAEISNFTIIDNTELLFKSYEAYLKTASIEVKDSFEVYSSWASTLLNDFNEIDRYLIDQKSFFNYLKSIKTLERWAVQNEQTDLITEYLKFWEAIPDLYRNLQSILSEENIAYQGMAFREAVSQLDNYVESNKGKTHVFIGFNAINTAEQHIIQRLLREGHSHIYWDTDSYFYKDTKHSASHFIRKYHQEWNYFEDKAPKFIADNFTKEKSFKIVQAQKNIAQAKYVGERLASLSEEELNKTAVILGDESFLTPLLYSLPENVTNINITMGVPLKNFPAAIFFELLLNIHLNESDTLYYKDVLSVLNHPLGANLIVDYDKISRKLISENITHISSESLSDMADVEDKPILILLFETWKDNSNNAINICLDLIQLLEKKFKKNMMERTVLYQLYSIFEKIKELNQKYPHLKSVQTVSRIFSELISITSLDFEGDAFKGLQVMGVLESRVLDFENIIITSVNEGVFPSGKSNSSFITYDLKKEFHLPLYTDKDAIYTYHFYRLLHRASNIDLVYNSYSEGINSGEKSRFIRQLEIDKHPNHNYEKINLSPRINIKPSGRQEIKKTAEIMQRLAEIAEKGFSPSALTSYIRNPIDFYFQKILKLNEIEEIEETVAANTLGTIIHDTLEDFYKPLEGKILKPEDLQAMKAGIPEAVQAQFLKTFKGGTFNKGKNLIIFEVAKRYIANFINLEIADLEHGNEIKILKIETRLSLDIPISELDFPVRIHGMVDRVDTYNGEMRIIDYKTGMVQQGDLEITDWEELTQDYKYSKAFQVLAYAAMIHQEIPLNNNEAGVISFKNLSSGFLKFGKRPKPRARERDQKINADTIDTFIIELKKLILEICDPSIAFIEKDIL